jgi:glucose/arabinose dehydrogenase
MKKTIYAGLLSLLTLFASAVYAGDTTRTKSSVNRLPDDVALTLQPGFASAVINDSVGSNRHIVVNANGDIYVKLERPKNGKGIVVLKESNGKAAVTGGFGDFGGTGIAIKNGYLYASSNSDVFRYKLNANNAVDPNQQPEKIITGLINKGQHESKSLALDNEGNIYVNVGAPSNSCQVADRQPGSLGKDPCPILDSAGGIWQFKADKLNQTYKDGMKYATGIRNVVGLDWNSSTNELFVMQHGRDGLFQMFPKYYNEEQGAEMPAEELIRVKKGGNYGWPYCYFDPYQSKKILAPEYGGDSKKQGRCSLVDTPVFAFPGHWGPNALLFYTGDQFPAKYKNGAFIAFHGSWNRAPMPQKGYKIVFVPFKDGKPSGEFEVFADGFKGAPEIESPGDAKHRPCGLAQGPDGSLYVSDDVKGTIWKITYNK